MMIISVSYRHLLITNLSHLMPLEHMLHQQCSSAGLWGCLLLPAPAFPPTIPMSPSFTQVTAPAPPFALSMAHRHRSLRCRPSVHRSTHSGYSLPRSRLRLHRFHPPRHTLLDQKLRQQLGHEGGMGWCLWYRLSTYMAPFPDKDCLVFHGQMTYKLMTLPPSWRQQDGQPSTMYGG